jgi:hypothetical protein
VGNKKHGDRWEEADYVSQALKGQGAAITLYWWLRFPDRGVRKPIGDSLITERTGLSNRSVKYARRLLKERGFIRCAGGEGRGDRLLYTFLCPWRKGEAHEPLGHQEGGSTLPP